jgi:hypothetical protein
MEYPSEIFLFIIQKSSHDSMLYFERRQMNIQYKEEVKIFN